MKLSVVIVAKCAQDTIGSTVSSLLKQEDMPSEILVVLDELSDPTAGVLRELPVEIILNEGSGIGAARQTGVKTSSGDVIAFIDADCIADREWIASLMRGFLNPDVYVQAGSVVGVDSALEQSATRKRREDRSTSHLKFAPTMNFAFRRRLVSVIGNFDPSFKEGGEDLDFCIRIRKARHAIHSNPRAIVYHLRHGFDLRRLLRDGKSRALAFVKHRSAAAGDALVVAFHMMALVGSLVMLIIGNVALAALVFAPSFGHRVYRAVVSVRSGNTALRSVSTSFAAYISYISFFVALPRIVLSRLSRKPGTSTL
ncbi:MAG: glycosyltransferase [Thermoplasmata archaeon]|nr:glycosyltransferase [Thermoplasmata archaeon]